MRAVGLIAAALLLMAACGDDDDAGVEGTSTAVASPDAAPTELPTIIAATATPPRGSPTATISEAEKEHGLRESLQDAMDASVSGYENFVGGVVAVAVRGEPPVVVTMGREVDPEGIFLIASITKTFTSTVILQLMEEGLLDLDDPIEALLPGVLEGESITVRHLLTHQSGLHSYTSADFRQDFTENPERRWLPLDVISPYLDRDRLSEPGEVYSYSNTNFIILGMVIEAVSGNPVSAAIRRRVLEPAGMERTYLAGAEEGPERVSSDSGEASNSRLSATWTAGAMASTASDLVAVRPRPVRGLPP